jgi:PAS domain S-box-containing protein
MGRNGNILDPEKTRKIEQMLRHNPRGMTISHLAVRLNMNRNLVAKYLDVLHYSGHVEMQITGTAKVYFLSRRIPISAMLEFSSDFIIVLDAELRILQVNTRLLSLLGLERDQVAGRRIDEIDHPFLRDISLCKLPPDPDHIDNTPGELVAALNNQQYYFSIKQVAILFEDGSSGLTLILEDITERRHAEENLRNAVQRREFFTQKLLEFTELPPGADIYMAIGKGLDALVPNAIISINVYDPRAKVVGKKAIFGERAEDLVACGCTHHYNWDAAPVTDKYLELHGTGKMCYIPGKIHRATFGLIPQKECKKIEREFDLGDIYSIGMIWRGKLLGNITFLLKNGRTIPNLSFIEVYVRVASLALQRHIAESAYHDGGSRQTEDTRICS